VGAGWPVGTMLSEWVLRGKAKGEKVILVLSGRRGKAREWEVGMLVLLVVPPSNSLWS